MGVRGRGRRLGLRTDAVAFSTGFDAAAQAFFNRLTPAPNATYQGYYNDLFKSLRTGGLLDILDALYLLGTDNVQWARQNLIQDAFNLTPVNAPTFTANQGYAGNGTSSYINTGFTPSTAGGHFSLNSAHISAYATGAVAANSVLMGGRTTSTTQQTLLVPNTSTGQYRVNQDMTSAYTSANSGFFVGSRTGSAAVSGYNDTTALGTATTPSTGVTNAIIFIGALNSAGTATNFSVAQLAAASIGGGLDATQEAALYNALHTFLHAVGAVA